MTLETFTSLFVDRAETLTFPKQRRSLLAPSQKRSQKSSEFNFAAGWLTSIDTNRIALRVIRLPFTRHCSADSPLEIPFNALHPIVSVSTSPNQDTAARLKIEFRLTMSPLIAIIVRPGRNVRK